MFVAGLADRPSRLRRRMGFVALAALRAYPVAKFAVGSVIALPACWGLAHLLRKALPRRGDRS
ncbi:hypothetical protein AB0G06_35145 [Nonomuraea dietziae]|uniref:hypothetical protein n=1 Tax=Nonomuraea dietziae TaxID=65515 RepID=UPI0033CF538A